jgi:hypothetical protein
MLGFLVAPTIGEKQKAGSNQQKSLQGATPELAVSKRKPQKKTAGTSWCQDHLTAWHQHIFACDFFFLSLLLVLGG